jgi:type IV pilus assembly protein PilX
MTNRTNRKFANQRGAALVIGLLLLLVLTLLALTGMTTATTELVMAGNEQYRKNATQAASAGVERAIGRIATVPTIPNAAPTVIPQTAIEGSSSDFYSTETRYVGEEIGLPQSSADKFVGLHYVIESKGTSARSASDQQVQGMFVVAAGGGRGNDGNFNQLGGGL